FHVGAVAQPGGGAARGSGYPIRTPVIELAEIGAGGGSIAWVDSGGALRVGPMSAGAEPGPASYGRGGTEPTVTDANLVLGYLAGGAVLGGQVTLDQALAVQALAGLPVDESLPNRFNPSLRDWVANATSSDTVGRATDAAAGVVRVVEAEMARALRVVSVERGIDPRGLALVAFGGAGPLHACALAEELGIERVLVPLASGMLSALGLAAADLRRDYVGGSVEELEARAAQDLPGATALRLVDARYRGQSHELTVEADRWEEHLAEAHGRRYGFRPVADPEIVTRRLVATLTRERPLLRGHRPSTRLPARRAYLDGDRLDLPVHGPGTAVTGPAIVELPGSTCLVRPGWAGAPDDAGTLVLERTWTR
ncbi:MAG TPA: hydantoinase/oxoprolinase family protein, partial [Gaiellales bacterium]|nr:hydantoinase/oxoprolinase family protein [Gaiellales bacterium]